MAEYVAANIRDLPPGAGTLVKIRDNLEVGLFNIEGTVYAVRNLCPHQGGPVCKGGLFDFVTAEVDDRGRLREYSEAPGRILACPWHGWEFDLQNQGRAIWNDRFRLRLYPVNHRENGDLAVVLSF